MGGTGLEPVTPSLSIPCRYFTLATLSGFAPVCARFSGFVVARGSTAGTLSNATVNSDESDQRVLTQTELTRLFAACPSVVPARLPSRVQAEVEPERQSARARRDDDTRDQLAPLCAPFRLVSQFTLF